MVKNKKQKKKPFLIEVNTNQITLMINRLIRFKKWHILHIFHLTIGALINTVLKILGDILKTYQDESTETGLVILKLNNAGN